MWNLSTEKAKKYGKGFIVGGLELQDALTQLNIVKDVDLKGDYPVLWTHRTMPGMEIYFLTNQSDKEINLSPSFRVNGLKPQLWDAMTGSIRPLNEYTKKDGRTSVSINMKVNQSWFVVFSNSKIVSNNTYDKNFPVLTVIKTLETPWSVDFKNKKIGPKESILLPTLKDWIENDNEKIKYYSGTAVYKSTFNYNRVDSAQDIFIDPGNVGVMASVKINGKPIGTTWIAPYQLSAINAIKEGKNTIEVEVVNVWRNRITGDKSLSEDKKTTWLLVDNITPEEALIPSGLLAPVTIKVVRKN